MRTLPFDLTNRIPATPVPEGGKIDRLLPGATAGILDVKPGELPRITESNRSFDNILGRVSKIETKPLDIKEFRKELPKLKLLDDGKVKPELKLEQQKMVAGARKNHAAPIWCGSTLPLVGRPAVWMALAPAPMPLD
jgi:hypothetical protein